MTAPRGADSARVVVYMRPACHLCDVAEEVVAEVCASTGATWTTVDITGDDDLVRRFTDQVPVTFVDGAQHDFWRVDPERLERALAQR
jgi:glutaredoxin